MKMCLKFLLPVIVLTAAFALSALPEARVVVKEVVTITVDKAEVRTDVPPINVRGRTLVPVRGVFKAFAAEIGWFPRERRVFIRKDPKVIWLQIGDAHAKVNDDLIPLEVPATIYRGRTMVPLRFIAEALGATVRWDPSAQTITILTREPVPP